MLILASSEKLFLLIVINDFPHKRASLSEEVVKSCRRGGISLVATATTEKNTTTNQVQPYKRCESTQPGAMPSQNLLKDWSTMKELFA